MRPLYLKMTAFGPFPGTEEINFQDLGENPLFLIHGPTGSGKTTILDAICFALYGKSTGDEREATQMRCDLSESGILTEIDLLFELSGKKYRIQRSPEQVRPKTRGEGTTIQAPKARFSELIDGGEEKLIVAGKVLEATAEIENLTGLNVDQFRQVMVLPQGRFRQLLMAESRDREQIFSNLFQTRIYKRLEDALKTRAAAIRRDVEKQKQISQGILEGAGLENIEALTEEIAELSRQKAEAEKNRLEKETLFLEASGALQKGQALSDQFIQLESTKAEQVRLTGLEPQIQKVREKLRSGEKAFKLSPLCNEVNRCRAELDATATKLEQTRKNNDLSKTKLEKATAKLDQVAPLSREIDHLKNDLHRLESYVERSAKLAIARQELLSAEKENREAAELDKKTGAELQKLHQEKEKQEKKLKQLQEKQTGLSQLQLSCKEAGDTLKNRMELENQQKRLNELDARLKQVEEKGRKLAQRHENLAKKEINLELNWHRGQAAVLARKLEKGQPCPVCGSMDHPDPAESADQIPTESDLKKAREEEQKAKKAVDAERELYIEIKQNQINLSETVTLLLEKLGEHSGKTLAELQQRHRELEESVQNLNREQKEVENLSLTLNRLNQEELSKKQEQEEIHSRATEKIVLLAAKNTAVENAEMELPEEYRKAGILEKKIEETRQLIVKKDQEISAIRKTHQDCLGEWRSSEASLTAAMESHQKQENAFKNAEEKWAAVLQESPFDSESLYLEALLDEEEIQNLKQEIENYEKQVNQVKGALEQQLSSLKGKQKPDLTALQESLSKAETTKSVADKAWQEIEGRLQQLETTRIKLETSDAGRKKLDKEYALIGTLSDVANGLTGNKVSLQRFVLSVLLDDVLIEASRRLKLMSKGRYQLLRKEDRAKGGRASGLDLEVEDAYSGKVRPVATLSGGESFMAALAMALGLSDVVQAYAGGIHLDTLFIDEGFGSLDPESLDLAIRTLVDLQSSGRMIGIISHVPDLQEQLSTRIEVISGQRGSRIQLIN